MRRWWLVAGAGVVVAGAAAAAVAFVLVRSGGGGTSAPPPAQGLWWEDLLRFVPMEPLATEGKTFGQFNMEAPRSEGDIILANIASVQAKLGALEGREVLCDALYDRIELPQDQFDRLMEPYIRLPAPDGLMSLGPDSPAATIGFESCQVDRFLTLPTISVYSTSVPDETIIRALITSAYSQSAFGDAAVFRKRGDWESDANDPLLPYVNRIALSDGYVVRGPAIDRVEQVLAAEQGTVVSGYAAPPVRGLLQALGDIDGVRILSLHPDPQDPSPMSVEWLRSITPWECVGCPPKQWWKRTSLGAEDWSDLPPPVSIALGSVIDPAGADVMKVALFYEKSDEAATARAELEKRLQTYLPLAEGKALCNWAEARTERVWEGTAVVGSCGGASQWTIWWKRLGPPNFLFLFSHIEWPGGQ